MRAHRPDESGHAAHRNPSAPHKVDAAIREPALHRARRIAHLPWRVRQPSGKCATATETCGEISRFRSAVLVYLGRMGSLSTLSRKQPGFPFGSVMPYGLDDYGRPIFLISTMAMHTQNLQADPRASLLVTQDDTGGDPLGAARVTLVGNVLPIPESEVPEARKLYLQRYANSKYWVDFEDFSFYRMDVVDVYYVGGFGVMGWVSASEYDRSQPDPRADSMTEITRHMNADHQDALLLLAREFARIESQEATMTAVDRLGFHVRVKTQDGTGAARIAFLREVTNPADTRKILLEIVQQARSQV